MRLQAKPSPANDFLLNNGDNLFLLLPHQQIRNQRHKEKEIENPSKYQGLFWGTRKLMEGWFAIADSHALAPENQASFQADFVIAEKAYNANGKKITEEIFLPDGFPAIAISYYGEFSSITFQPEFDIRDRYSHNWTDYSSSIESGRATIGSQGVFATLGDSGGDISPLHQYRYKFYPQDYDRNDIAERWCFSPCTIKGKRFFIGFGNTPEEARTNYERLRNNYEELKMAKSERIRTFSSRFRLKTNNDELNRAFQLAVLQFLSLQFNGCLPASGDRWFAGDKGWLRDSMISLEAYFELGLYDKARQILGLWLRKENMNGEGVFADRLDPPGWRGFDGTLWLFRRAGEYALLTGDKKFFEEKADLIRASLEQIIDKRQNAKGLVRCKPYETWMDTEFTPREGFPIEVQALFIYDCLLLAKLFDERFADKLLRSSAIAINALQSFKCSAKLGGVARKYFADLLTGEMAKYSALTPNQLIALDCGVVDEELEADILILTKEKLAGKGIRTLAPDEVGYFEKHVGDGSYHRGNQWPVFNSMAAKREIKAGHTERAYNIYIYPLISDILAKNFGGIPELYNGDGTDAPVPHYQAWSLASFIVSCKEYERAVTRQTIL